MAKGLRKERVKGKSEPKGKMKNIEKKEDVLFINYKNDVFMDYYALFP